MKKFRDMRVIRKFGWITFFLLMPLLVRAADDSTCKTPDGKIYKLNKNAYVPLVLLDYVPIKSEQELSKYIKVLSERGLSETFKPDGVEELLFINELRFKNISDRSIGEMKVFVVYYDSDNNPIFDESHIIYYRNGCSGNYPLKPGYVDSTMAITRPFPKEASTVKVMISEIGFAVEAK